MHIYILITLLIEYYMVFTSWLALVRASIFQKDGLASCLCYVNVMLIFELFRKKGLQLINIIALLNCPYQLCFKNP